MKVLVKMSTGLARDWAFWRRAPKNDLTMQGFEILPDFLDAEECRRLVAVTDSYLADRSYAITDNAYLVRRRDSPRGKDRLVSQVMNAQDIDPRLHDLYASGRIEKIFAERVGEPVTLLTITLQVDDPDT